MQERRPPAPTTERYFVRHPKSVNKCPIKRPPSQIQYHTSQTQGSIQSLPRKPWLCHLLLRLSLVGICVQFRPLLRLPLTSEAHAHQNNRRNNDNHNDDDDDANDEVFRDFKAGLLLLLRLVCLFEAGFGRFGKLGALGGAGNGERSAGREDGSRSRDEGCGNL